MKTLFEKDLRLILLRRSTLFIFLVIGVIFTWQFSDSFSGAYMTMLGNLLALGTLSYDDNDNCMAFLFTLPCTRKQYVMEKYLFVYGFSFLAGLIGMAIIIISNLVSGNPITILKLAEILASELPILFAVGGIMIPLQLKFGPEKSRIVFLGIFGVIAIALYALSELSPSVNLLGNLVKTLDAMNPVAVTLGLAVILAAMTIISFIITTKIMENKEL